VLTPSPAELLAGVADALAATVLPELAPGPARRQVQAAIGITRRVAAALPRLGPYLAADVADLAATLERLSPAGSVGAGPPVVTEASPAGGGAGPEPAIRSLTDLADLDRRLQQALADVIEGLARPSRSAAGPADRAVEPAPAQDAGGPPADDQVDADAEVRALLGRMLAREMELGLSPWEA
jgi:hypothetical protein